MTLHEAIQEALRLDSSFDEEAVLFSQQTPKTCTPDTLCLILPEGEDATIIEHNGQIWHYFLEVSLVRELFENGDDLLDPTMLQTLFGNDASAMISLPAAEARTLRVIYYAAHDV